VSSVIYLFCEYLLRTLFLYAYFFMRPAVLYAIFVSF